MARHNRMGSGEDQFEFTHEIDYPPDWLRHVKVTRALAHGRQSTKTLFRNEQRRREADPGERLRLGVSSPRQKVDFDLMLRDTKAQVVRVRVTCRVPGKKGAEEVEYTFEGALPAPKGR